MTEKMLLLKFRPSTFVLLLDKRAFGWMLHIANGSFAARTMTEQTNARKGSAEGENGEEGTEKRGQRGYASYSKVEQSFDPMKDLNLPGSYEEVVARFKRLQVMRALEALN
jgi:hypothetical protein